jgi:type II pantothenate kinase
MVANAQTQAIAVEFSQSENNPGSSFMDTMLIAVDIGMSNIDLVWDGPHGMGMHKLENDFEDPAEQVRQALAVFGDDLSLKLRIGVTGGHYRELPDAVAGYPISKVDEMLALGWGGLAAANQEAGLVVSAGTGTAMVAARRDTVAHVTGSAVGGGTLQGLANLILGTSDVAAIDRLALAGDAAAVDIMLREAVGGEVGRLPAHANAVNLGKLMTGVDFKQEDLAAGLVRLVAQVIAVIAINAADACGMEAIVLIGHTMDLRSIQNEIAAVGEFYQRKFIMPENPGFATAMGVIEALKRKP